MPIAITRLSQYRKTEVRVNKALYIFFACYVIVFGTLAWLEIALTLMGE